LTYVIRPIYFINSLGEIWKYILYNKLLYIIINNFAQYSSSMIIKRVLHEIDLYTLTDLRRVSWYSLEMYSMVFYSSSVDAPSLLVPFIVPLRFNSFHTLFYISRHKCIIQYNSNNSVEWLMHQSNDHFSLLF